MTKYRVLVLDGTMEMEAESEAHAEELATAHLREFPPGHPDSPLGFVTFEVEEFYGPDQIIKNRVTN